MAAAHQNVILDRIRVFSLSIQLFARQVSYNTRRRYAQTAACATEILEAGWPKNDAIAGDAKPRLPRGVRLTHNEAQGGWVLLAPERIFKADAIAAEILKRCTGEATLRRNRR